MGFGQRHKDNTNEENLASFQNHSSIKFSDVIPSLVLRGGTKMSLFGWMI